MCESNGILISAQTTLSNWKCVKSGAWLKCVSVHPDIFSYSSRGKQKRKRKNLAPFSSPPFFTVNTFMCAYTFFSGKLAKMREKSGIQWIRRKGEREKRHKVSIEM